MRHQASDVHKLVAGHARLRDDWLGMPAFRNWRVTWRLIALIVIPTAMGLVFGVIRVATADSASNQFGQIETLARLGQQVTGLEQSLDDERDLAAGYIAGGRSAVAYAQLKQQYAVTDSWVSRVRASLAGLGTGYPAQAQARIQGIQFVLRSLPQVRAATSGSATASAIGTVDDYTTGLTIYLLSYTDDIAPDSADPTLVDTARTLGWLARMEDETSQERAIMYSGLLGRHFEDTATVQLGAAQTQQSIDTSQFESSATLNQEHVFLTKVANAGLAAVEDQGLITVAIETGSPARLGVTASQWYASTSDTLGRMRGVEQQLVGSEVTRAQQLHQGAADSARISAVLSALLLLAALAATFAVARSIVRPLRKLRSDALQIANVRLPEKMQAIAEAEDPDAEPDVVLVSVGSADEIGQVARAFDQVHQQAVRLAANEAVLRRSMNAIFVNLSRRSQSLLMRLVSQIDSLEQSEDDPGRLASLFTMDHLVTRMRRHSENLLVLAGHESARKQAEPVALPDVVRAAVSEILEYDRVAVSVQAEVSIAGQSVSDIVHLLAEILENATMFSAKDAMVHVSGEALTSGGALINVTDKGVGIPVERLAGLNDRLDNPPAADVSVSRHMGLFAVSHLAARHGVRVRLRHAEPTGLTALVWIPERLITRQRLGGWQRTVHTVRPVRPAEQSPVYATVAAEWFGRADSAAAYQAAPAQDSAADAGWQAAAAAAAPAHSGYTTAGLPQRSPRANLIPGSAGERPRTSEGASGPAARSADRARTRLGGFQRGSHRAERAVKPPEK
jgi:signal transduction histidine kinase